MESAQLAGNRGVRPEPHGPPMRALQAGQLEGGRTDDRGSISPPSHPPHHAAAAVNAGAAAWCPAHVWVLALCSGCGCIALPAREGGALGAGAAGWPARLSVRTPWGRGGRIALPALEGGALGAGAAGRPARLSVHPASHFGDRRVDAAPPAPTGRSSQAMNEALPFGATQGPPPPLPPIKGVPAMLPLIFPGFFVPKGRIPLIGRYLH